MQIHENNVLSFYRPKNILGQSKTFWKSLKRQNLVVKMQIWSGKSKIIWTRPNYFCSGPKSIFFSLSRKDPIQLYDVNIECFELDKEDKQYINALC